MNIDNVEFNRGVISPMECFREGWQLIKEDYWLFFGITFVGVFIGGMGPMAVLVGPMMCGIYLCLLQQERGKKVTFDMVFKGFEFFAPSLIATLIMVVPIILMVLVLYAFLLIGVFAIIGLHGNNRQGPPPEQMMALFGAYGIGIFLLILASIPLKAFFLFIYLLIVDKQVSGWEAVRLSFRAVRGNFGGILGLVLLSECLGFIGFLCCGVGAYLEMPLSFAMFTVAYRQIFPAHDPFARFSDDGDDEHDDLPRRRSADSDTSMRADPA